LIPGVPILMSRFGEAIRERREVVGYKTATDCATASHALAIDNPSLFKGFSQSSLSRWELDHTGGYIQGAHGKSLRTLAYLLKWRSDEFEANVGVPVGKVPFYDSDSSKTSLSDSSGVFAIPGGLVVVPVLGVANGGRPGSYGLPVEPGLVRGENTRAFQVEGNSMEVGLGGIRDGSWVLVDTSITTPANGRVFLLEIIGDGMTVKRLRQVGGEWLFLSDNPDVNEAWRDDQVRILGEVYGRVDYSEVR
jgi:repressor LexA